MVFRLGVTTVVLAIAMAGCVPAGVTPPEASTVLNNLFAPKSGKVGSSVELRLLATGAHGCSEFVDAKLTINTETRTVSVSAIVDDDAPLGVGCTQLVVCLEKTVSFTPTRPGAYTIKARVQPEPNVRDCAGPWTHLNPPLSPNDFEPVSDDEVPVAGVHDVTLTVLVSE